MNHDFEGEQMNGESPEQLGNLRQQFNQLKILLERSENRSQDNNSVVPKPPTQIERTTQTDPIATWKEKV
ncbi:unnamed protein product [Amaranthus hypochondriacus]